MDQIRDDSVWRTSVFVWERIVVPLFETSSSGPVCSQPGAPGLYVSRISSTCLGSETPALTTFIMCSAIASPEVTG